MDLENQIGIESKEGMSFGKLSKPMGRDAIPMDFRGTVLIADDEAIVRMVLEEMLVRMGFDVFTAEDGRLALELFRKDPDRFDLVIFDMTMPNMSGDELFAELRLLKPDILTVLSSGYQEEGPVEEMMASGLSGVLPKPYNIIEIGNELNRVFGKT